MASYHLRVKDDTKSGGKRNSAKEKEPKATKMIVFSKEINYRSGRKVPRKNFSHRRHAMRTKEIIVYVCQRTGAERIFASDTASEIRENLLGQYRFLKNQHEKAVDNRNSLMLSQVSPINALNCAKNIFVHDDFDKLHAQQEEYEEASTQFANNIILPNKKSSWK